MDYRVLIDFLQRIEHASAACQREASAESHAALKQALLEGYFVFAAQQRTDPVIRRIRQQILRQILSMSGSMVHALDLEGATVDAPRGQTVSEPCTEFSNHLADLCRIWWQWRQTVNKLGSSTPFPFDDTR